MKTINIFERVGSSFAEDKDAAAAIRLSEILPDVLDGNKVELDFSGIELTTQSFVHALISDVLRQRGIQALDALSFKNCVDSVKGIIETVVQYVLETIKAA